jgi:hypothetical protein
VAVAVLAFVGAGVVGLAYRTGAAEPFPPAGVPVAGGPAQAAADDLEALRLEIEALRKELRATRERVRALEDQVVALQGMKAGPGAGSQRPDAAKLKEALERELQKQRAAVELNNLAVAEQQRREAKEAADLLAEAEAALKRLHADPADKGATDALEKALQRLKERAKPRRNSLRKN